ncbi:hypothetical protein PHJA_001990700 [Phtheirospermum japonicum]|uniref:Protein COFACTOR ASSEMBLY OF COMPLEX C SUBUNIT B CCB3, chloroplastic n=1 Tax=Phtheirospermum japonicum TaxID=374723 RepID=A0A830CMC5_9LAMI|nr:hypothetical protein PHJA_001990700 [Phtheirospermum japonicum]
MSGVSATGVGFSWPCKSTQHINDNQKPNWKLSTSSQFPIQKTLTAQRHTFRTHCLSQVPISLHNHHHHLSSSAANLPSDPFDKIAKISDPRFLEKLVLVDLDPATAKLAIGLLGPFLSAFGFLFILRIVMSWYPKLPVEKFPYVIAYAPTEPLLVQTRKLIPPLGGVDVTPVVWFGLLSFLNEILVGPQGLLVLLSQQV